MPLFDPSVLNKVSFIVGGKVVGLVTDLLFEDTDNDVLVLLVYDVIKNDYCRVTCSEDDLVNWEEVVSLSYQGVYKTLTDESIVSLKEAFEEVLITFYVTDN